MSSTLATPAAETQAAAEKDDLPLYNSRLFDTFLRLVKDKYRHVDINEILNYAGMKLYEIEDEGHWFTQTQSDRFHDIVVRLTGNKNIAREAGRYAASPEALGFLRHLILANVDPVTTYELIGRAAPNLTRAESLKARRIAASSLEIIVTIHEGVNEKPYQCENRLGYFEAISTVFNYRMPRIDHEECAFREGKVCRYTVTWFDPPSVKLKVFRNYIYLCLLLISILFAVFTPWTIASIIVILSLSALHVLAIHILNTERAELRTAIDSIKVTSDKLIEQVNKNYSNALLINEIGRALSRTTNLDSLLQSVIIVLQERLDYDRGIILLANEEKTRLEFRAGFGYDAELLRIITRNSFRLDKPWSKGIFYLCFTGKKPFLVNNIDEIMADLSPKSLKFAHLMGSKSFICCPILYEDESVGILAVDNVVTKRPLLQSDINLLMGIAPEIGVSIHNQMMIESRERQFNSLLQVLAATIDARDFLTAGHSDKVTDYAVGICRELGMSKDYTEMIRVASLLHDYGKIGIPDSILKKEGKLTPEEYEEIKTHSEKTRLILERVNFEGIYREVPEIAGAHHEKMDGSGYPNGLSGEQIPLGARIIAVADFFEAITAKRHYRDPLPLDAAFRLLVQESGKHLDEKVVSAFISYYAREYGSLPKIDELQTLHVSFLPRHMMRGE